MQTRIPQGQWRTLNYVGGSNAIAGNIWMFKIFKCLLTHPLIPKTSPPHAPLALQLERAHLVHPWYRSIGLFHWILHKHDKMKNSMNTNSIPCVVSFGLWRFCQKVPPVILNRVLKDFTGVASKQKKMWRERCGSEMAHWCLIDPALTLYYNHAWCVVEETLYSLVPHSLKLTSSTAAYPPLGTEA